MGDIVIDAVSVWELVLVLLLLEEGVAELVPLPLRLTVDELVGESVLELELVGDLVPVPLGDAVIEEVMELVELLLPLADAVELLVALAVGVAVGVGRGTITVPLPTCVLHMRVTDPPAATGGHTTVRTDAGGSDDVVHAAPASHADSCR